MQLLYVRESPTALGTTDGAGTESGDDGMNAVLMILRGACHAIGRGLRAILNFVTGGAGDRPVS